MVYRPMIEVITVVYRANVDDLRQSLTIFAWARKAGVPLSWCIWHNDDEKRSTSYTELYEEAKRLEVPLRVEGGIGNLGFGRGINAALTATEAKYVLLLNQDAIPEPGSIEALWSEVASDSVDVAAWEMRQIPYEHPKRYNPVTLEAEWVSGAAVLLRVDAMRAVGGFEPRIFMYGEDVDLSWRLRCKGWRLRYLPRCTVIHKTYSAPDEVKPLQVIEGIFANLCLRARFSGRRRVLEGLMMALGELFVPASFPGRRRGIVRAILKFFRNYSYFRNTHHSSPTFEPIFNGWGFEERREGAFFELRSAQEWATKPQPLVSVLVRTHKRPALLRQALASVANQTWRNLEVVVVEDGSSEGETVCNAFRDKLTIRYVRLSPAVGRAAAGNRALAEARGEWLCFLDDDDLLFSDHIEVLVQTVQESGLLGAYALAWRVFCRTEDNERGVIREIWHDTFPDEPFSRYVLWRHNFMPIQSVLFHRSLYERYGGFAVDMDQLEDWNLWTRYTLENDFVQVRKVTSLYRVPADPDHSARRQALLDAAYEDALKRQRSMKFSADPEMIRTMAYAYAKSNALIHLGEDQVRRVFNSVPYLRRVASLRHVLQRRFGRK